MAEPTVIVRIAFDTDPLAAVPTWTDISADVLSFYTKRGRQHELGRMETGIANVLLKNVDGDYWPLNTLGAYTGKVLPGKKINIRATYNSITYDIYTGFIEAWEPAWLGEKIAITKVRCADIGKRFSRFDLNNAGEAEELSGTRVGNVLDEIGWPANTWTSPTGFVDSEGTWTAEPNAYDENTGTSATGANAPSSWSDFLELTVAAMECNAIRYYGYAVMSEDINQIDLDVYYDSAWHHVYSGSPGAAGWHTHYLDAAHLVTAMRVRFYNSSAINPGTPFAFEFDFGMFYRSLDAGQTTVKATGAQVAVNAMTHLFLVQDSEVGILFLSPGGVVTFQDRHARLKSPYTTSQATFGDDTGEQKYRFLNPSYDDQFIYNDIRRTRDGGTEQTASDATSQDDYGKSTDNKTGLLMLLDTEAQDQCDYMLVQYKDPHFRIRGLETYPGIDPDNLFPKVLGYDISTRITLRLNEASLDQDYHIEGIIHNFDRRRAWTTRWQLSDATGVKYWVLGVAGFSELSLTTTLAY